MSVHIPSEDCLALSIHCGQGCGFEVVELRLGGGGALVDGPTIAGFPNLEEAIAYTTRVAGAREVVIERAR